MKKLAAFCIGLSLAACSSAHAQGFYCGKPRETMMGPAASVRLPNGQSMPAVWTIPADGLDDGHGMPGAAVQGNHRACGETAVYLYTGDNPRNWVNFTIKLNPTIISPGVVMAKCVAMLGRTVDAYYAGYNGDVRWPAGMNIYGEDSHSDGANMYVTFAIYGGSPLTPHATYSVSIICPYNMPQG